MARSDRKMLIYFPRAFPLVSYRWVNSPHVINTILNIMPLFKFCSGNLPGLAASGLRLGFAGSQNNPQPPLPPSLKYNVRNSCLNVILNQLYIFQRRIACNVQSIFTPKMNWKPRSKKRLNSNLTELHNFLLDSSIQNTTCLSSCVIDRLSTLNKVIQSKQFRYRGG